MPLSGITYPPISSCFKIALLKGLLVFVTSSTAQTLTVKQLGTCKDDKIGIAATTDGRFRGWSRLDGSTVGIANKDSLSTLVMVDGQATFVATSEFRSANLIKNGDFEQDTNGLTTDYSYKARIDQPGDFTIVANPNAGRSTPVYALIGDHTSGKGKMMVVDGDTGSKQVVKYRIPVEKDVQYRFSLWIANIHKKLVFPGADTTVNKMPRLQFFIDKNSLGVYDFSFDSLWHPFSISWKATKNDTVLVEIVDLQKKQKANDFALDDLEFYAVDTKQERITVEGCSKRDVFSPDGDGIMDTYYIEELGWAKIFDLDGNLVKEIPTPGHWDGTKRNGLLAEAGYYAVVINNAKSYRVSLMR